MHCLLWWTVFWTVSFIGTGYWTITHHKYLIPSRYALTPLPTRWIHVSKHERLDFGPHNLVMSSSTDRLLPNLYTYERLTNEKGVFKRYHEVLATFEIHRTLERLMILNHENKSTEVYRSVDQTTRWFMDETGKSLLILVSPRRGAFFEMGSFEGHWIAVHAADFNLLNHVKVGNDTFVSF